MSTAGETVECLEGVRANVEIDDGSAVTVATDERGAVLRVQTPTVEPLDRRQTALTLAVSGDESTVTVELDDVQRERLARVLDGNIGPREND